MAAPVTVLAVDDEPTNLRLLDAVLTPRGHRVITKTSGAEALLLLETEDVDLVLLDILMPEIDGTKSVGGSDPRRRRNFFRSVITASGREQRLAALQAGADDFVTKPFDQSELLARVASLARIKRYHRHHPAAGRRTGRWNTELETRVAAQVAELERPTGYAIPVAPTGRSGGRRQEPVYAAIAAKLWSSSPISGISRRSRRPVSPKR